MIVGRFAEPADVSGVSTGSQIMMTLTNLVSSLSMGMTVFLGQKIGERKSSEGSVIVANGIMLFLSIGLFLTLFITLFAGALVYICGIFSAAL